MSLFWAKGMFPFSAERACCGRAEDGVGEMGTGVRGGSGRGRDARGDSVADGAVGCLARPRLRVGIVGAMLIDFLVASRRMGIVGEEVGKFIGEMGWFFPGRRTNEGRARAGM